LQLNKINQIESKTNYNEYVSAVATISTWEILFNTTFHSFEHTIIDEVLNVEKTVVYYRALSYSLPNSLIDHVSAVFNTVQFPDRFNSFPTNLVVKEYKSNAKFSTQATGYATPSLINQVYAIKNNTGNQLVSQAIYAALGQSFSPADLTKFQQQYNLPVQSISNVIGGHKNDTACKVSSSNCDEANLDVQYLTAVSQRTPTTFFYWNGTDYWLNFIIKVGNMVKPPKVISISYGSYENQYSNSYFNSFNVQAQALGLQGVTIVVSSGDDGVAGFNSRTSTSQCGYYPQFPASSPYVVAVGGTRVRRT
jgi:tripeptidyl-peptidase-1